MNEGAVAGFVAGVHHLIGEGSKEELKAVGIIEKGFFLREVAEDGRKLFGRRLVAIGLPVVDVEKADDLVVGKVAVIGIEKGRDIPHSFGIHHFELEAGLDVSEVVRDLEEIHFLVPLDDEGETVISHGSASWKARRGIWQGPPG